MREEIIEVTAGAVTGTGTPAPTPAPTDMSADGHILHDVEVALRTLSDSIGGALTGEIGLTVRTTDVLRDVRTVAETALGVVCAERARRGDYDDADEVRTMAEHIRATAERLAAAHDTPVTDAQGRVFTWSCRYCRCLCYRTLAVCPRCGTPAPDGRV